MNLERLKKFNIDKTNWKPVKFGDVVQEVRETIKDPETEGIDRIVGLEHIEPENIHLRKFAPLKNGTTFSRRFRKGQVLFGRRRAYLKKAAIAEFDGICSGDIIVMEAKEKLNPMLLPFIVNNDRFFDYAVKTSAGSLSPRTKFQYLAEYEFLLPPKDRQEKITELLWVTDNMLLHYIDVESKMDVLLKSTLQNLLSGRTRISKSNVFYKDESFKKYNHTLPSSWVKCKVGENAYIKGRIGWRGLKQSEYTTDGPYLIASKHIANGTIYWEKCDHISIERYKESSEIALMKGDIIFSKDGALGNPALINNLPGDATINSTMMLVRPNKNILSHYMLYILKSNYFENLLRQRVSGSAIPHIFQDDMKKFSFPLPPLEEQKMIVDKLLSIEAVLHSLREVVASNRNIINNLTNNIF